MWLSSSTRVAFTQRDNGLRSFGERLRNGDVYRSVVLKLNRGLVGAELLQVLVVGHAGLGGLPSLGTGCGSIPWVSTHAPVHIVVGKPAVRRGRTLRGNRVGVITCEDIPRKVRLLILGDTLAVNGLGFCGSPSL